MEKKELSVRERLELIKLRNAELNKETFAKLEKMQDFIDDGRRLFGDKIPKRIPAEKSVEKPTRIPGLQEKLAASRALNKRIVELDKSQQVILDELAATPLEEQCDAVYAQMGQKLYTLEQQEIADAEAANNFLEEEDKLEASEEELERSGKPPPLRQVK